MRVFQNSGLYPAYRRRLDRLATDAASFAERRAIFLDDRYAASHFLAPVLEGAETGFLTNGDDDVQQGFWARENGLPRSATAEDILLAQIEAHRTEVFYNLDPMRFGSAFVRRLPGCVRRSIAWRAAPSPGADFAAYDLVVCNFPSILADWAARGLRTAWFAPAHDPVMDAYAANTDRPVDVIFFGGYSRHHRRRAAVLEEVARMAKRRTIHLHLDRSRMTRLAETPLGLIGPLRRHRRPPAVRRASREPLFGRDLYAALSQAKIVLNGAVDMAGEDRGNMRCWEAMGCGALLLSDAGRYPDGMRDGETMVEYDSVGDVTRTIDRLMADTNARLGIAKEGQALIRTRYSKSRQWLDFQTLAA